MRRSWREEIRGEHADVGRARRYGESTQIWGDDAPGSRKYQSVVPAELPVVRTSSKHRQPLTSRTSPPFFSTYACSLSSLAVFFAEPWFIATLRSRVAMRSTRAMIPYLRTWASQGGWRRVEATEERRLDAELAAPVGAVPHNAGPELQGGQ